MLHKNRLFTPGPTPLLPAAQTAMASFTAHHRTADFKALFQRVLADMKDFIGTKNDVLVLASLGHGRHGSFRFESDVSGRQGSGAHSRQVRRALDRAGQGLRLQCGRVERPVWPDVFAGRDSRAGHADVRAVYVQATESSTGARHDVQGIAKIVRGARRRGHCWSWTRSPAWARRISMSMAGAST